jgi:small subunit ribosomal protein S7e
MFSAQSKIRKKEGETADEIETAVCQALFELEMTSDLKNQLRELQIVGAKEYEVGDKRALAIFIPQPQLRAWQILQTRVVRELEKKFSGKHVAFVARRTILPKPGRKSRHGQKQKRPINRTLTSVHDAYLSDLVYPAEIVGKRVRVRLDGSTLTKVHLDKQSQTNIEHKIDTFAGVYKRITGKEVAFEFPDPIF